MDERQVKAAILEGVRKASGRCAKPIVAPEFSLGSSGVRADLAVFAETSIGFEIKSSRDTLRRLPMQMKAYAQYFSHSIAVVARSHVPHVKLEALHGGSLWTYDDDGSLRPLIEGITNAVGDDVLVELMTQAERRRGDFFSAMVARYAINSHQFWSTVARRPIRPTDLSLLSRFYKDRVQARQLLTERDEQWARWLAAQEGAMIN